VGVLTLLYCMSLLDRQVIGLLVAPIRADLAITDFQMSLLQGFAFALFFSLFGLPLGLAADRLPRRAVIFAGAMLWALAASACGLAGSYTELMIARFAVGIGEAALLPAAYSLISDSFPRHRLAFALSVFSTGNTIGAGLALAAGGLLLAAMPAGGVDLPLLGHLAPWQAVFMLTGLPCAALAWLAFTAPDPGRGGGAPAILSLRDAAGFIRANRRFLTGHFLGFGLSSLCGYGFLVWTPTYMTRAFGWPMSTVGVSLALAITIAGSLGPVLLGAVIDRWYRAGRHDAHLVTYAITVPLQALIVVTAMTVRDPGLFLALATANLSLASFSGASAAALQITTPPSLRGQVSACFLFCMSMLGAGCGPSVVAALTDFVFRSDARVGWSIAATFLVFAPLSSALLLLAAREVRRRPQAASQAGAAAAAGVVG
jgi:MFS family permease